MSSPPAAPNPPAEPADKQKKDTELSNFRLAGRPPLSCLMNLAFGPLMSQISGSLYGFINTIWIGRVLGEIYMTAISTATTFDNIGRSFGYFMCVSASSRISSLFALHKEEEASQVFCDLLRASIICGIIVPSILCPVEPIAVKWFGASQDVIDYGYQYISPIFYCSVFTCFFLTVSGALQAEGRTTLVGLITLISLIICVGGLVPLFLYVFKWGMKGAGVATVLSEAVPATCLIICYFCGVFTVKPHPRQLLNKFSSYTWTALKVGISQLFSNLSVSIPGIVMRKLIGMSVSNSTDFDDALAGFNIIFRYANLVSAVLLGLNMGYIPAASYANSAGNHKRYLALTGHLLWIGFTWSFLTFLISMIWPRQIASIFGDGDSYLYWAQGMLKAGNSGGILLFSRFNIQAVFQAKQLGGRASIVSLSSQLISIIVAAIILYYTDKDNPIRLTYSYLISYSFGLVLGIILLIKPAIQTFRELKAQQAKEVEEAGGLQEIEEEEDKKENEITEL